MTEAVRRVHRNRVDVRIASFCATLGALIAVLSGAAPVNAVSGDVILVLSSAWLVIWASASAPWWAGAIACGIGASIALDPVVVTLGAMGFIAGLVVGVQQRDNGTTRAVIGAIAVNTLIRSDLDGFHGLSAVIGICTCAALLILGLGLLVTRRREARNPVGPDAGCELGSSS